MNSKKDYCNFTANHNKMTNILIKKENRNSQLSKYFVGIKDKHEKIQQTEKPTNHDDSFDNMPYFPAYWQLPCLQSCINICD